MSEKGISAIAIRTQLEDQALGPVHDASLLAVVALLLLRKLPMLAIASLFFLGTVPTTVARENHNRREFVTNPQCTIGEDWDPEVDEPSDAALMQLAPTGSLRVGVFYSNPAIAQLDPDTGRLSGTAIDVACRMAAELELPLEFHGFPSIPAFLTAFEGGEFEIGFAVDPLNPTFEGFGIAHAYIGIENSYLVPIDSPFPSSADVDWPGVRISVPTGTSPDFYLTDHLKFATLVRTTTPLLDLRAGLVDVAATSRGPELGFIKSQWRGQGRILPDNFLVVWVGPAMKPGNPDGVCYLSSYVNGAIESGLITEVIARSSLTLSGGGLEVPPNDNLLENCE
jgi:polar amino acid transport system substrate-binding protein